MIYVDNTNEYSQRIYIPKDEADATSGVTGHTITLQSKDYIINQNGTTRIHADAGYDGISGGTIGVYVSAVTGVTFQHLEATEDGLYVPTGDTAYSGVTVQVYDGAYHDGYLDGYNSGYTSGNTDGYASGSTDGYETGYSSGFTDGYASGYTEGYADGYSSGNTDGYASGHTDGYAEGYTSGSTDGYASGHTDGYAEGYSSGNTDGYASGHTDGYAEGYSSGSTVGYASGHTDGYAEGYSSGHTDGYAEGYLSGQTDGYATGYSSGQTDGYSSGYTEGYASGHTEGYDEGFSVGYSNGVIAQKQKLTQITATTNGTYAREDGYSSVEVAVDLVGPYNSGYTSGYTVGYSSGSTDGYSSGYTEGVSWRDAQDIAGAFTENGTYHRSNGYGWNEVNVRVPTEVNNQTLSLNINETWMNNHSSGSFTINPDSGYTGFNKVNINTNGMILSGNHNLGTYTANSTYTETFSGVYASGVSFTVAVPLIANTLITQNGVYSASTQNAEGYSVVEVNVSGGSQSQIVTLTQAQYNALNPPDPNIIYLIKD